MEQEILMEIFKLGNIVKYLIIINIALFLLMWYDKHEAKVHQWRISEKTLFIFALIGGSLGGLIGMYVFHHKTRKWYFKFGFPAMLICQIILTLIIIF